MNVEEVLTKHKIVFIPSGKDFLIKCLNPEHDDSNPSMRMDRVTGIFHCFSCGHRGNIFSKFGIEQSRLDMLRNSLKKKIEQTALERVGLQIPEDAIFWDEDYRGISAATYKKFKAFTYEEEFPNRLVFPIYDITGKITNFSARSFDPFAKPKYKLYPAGSQAPIYPMTNKPKFSTIVLVEGVFDMLKLYDSGVTFVMTAFGTQTVNEDKLSLLKMLGVHELHVLFDGDEAGQAAAEKVIPLADSMGFHTKNIVLTNYFDEGADPGSLTREQIRKLKTREWPEY